MKTIVLISCVNQKLDTKAKAKNLYISPLFIKNLNYAKSLSPDHIFILSAKYGLVGLEEEIEPYDKTLNILRSYEVKYWAKSVLDELKRWTDLENDNYIFLAGNKYRKFLLPEIKNYEIPMEGLSIGRQLQWLNKQLTVEKEYPSSKQTVDKSDYCGTLHQWFNRMKKYSFPFEIYEIPKNGIYILFEKGELGHSINRIVRIGTHTGNNQLSSRLNQHFINENKDRSIFRKNIGRALLAKDNDPFLELWELDLTTRKAKEEYSHLIEFNKQNEIEKRVTQYIHDNFWFVVFQVDDITKRLDIEAKIISTISHCKKCIPSKTWLGNFSPKEKIKKSGLWQVNELWKTPLSGNEMADLGKIFDTTFDNT